MDTYRVRSRTEPRNEIPTQLELTVRDFTEYWGVNGQYVDLPLRDVDVIQMGAPDLKWCELRNSASTIIDEHGIVGHRVKYCDQVAKTACIVPKYIHAWNPTNGVNTLAPITRQSSYGAARWAGFSNLPGLLAWELMYCGSRVDFNATVRDSSLTSALASQPVDRLGEIPARLRSALEEWHSTTTLVEASELPQLFALFSKRGPLKGSVAAIEQFIKSRSDFCSRHRRASAVATIRNLCEQYREGQLGLTFGILPTVSDVRTISEILTKGVKPRKTRIVRTINGMSTADLPAVVASSYQTGKCRRTENVKLFRVDGAVLEAVRPEVRSNMQNMINRLVGVNGAGIIWEVIPFSFIVDWFLSVDDALDTLWLQSQNDYTVSYWSSTKLTYRKEVTYSIPLVEVYPMTSSRYRPAPDPVWMEYTHYTRTPRPPPTAFSSLHFRMGPLQGFYTILVALGLMAPRRS